MSLGTRLTLKTIVIVGALVGLALVAWAGLNGLNRDLDAALEEYDQLRQVYELAVTIEQARIVLRTDPGNAARLRPMVMRAMLELDEPALALRPELVEQLRGDLRAVSDALSGGGEVDPEPMAGALNTATNRLTYEADQIERRIAAVGVAADARRARVTRWVGGAAIAASALVIAIGVWQYLAVMRPLRRLERGVSRLARGDFTEKLVGTGDREFVRLAEDFNDMAEQLGGLYQSLEDKVRQRSRQLAQSERLASVGFLAAGVAHEINNPLAIIAGEAELALRALPESADEQARQGLAAIRDEAFRCKGITQKLLSLARPGGEVREAVDLPALAGEVAALVRTLAQYDSHRIEIGGQAPRVTSNAAQLKQVLLNLVINALEASPAGAKVQIDIAGSGDKACLSVIDHGQGMDESTRSKVFEPFYTQKKSPSQPGLGLGLSISHAIIEDLGGRLTVESPGLGQGSTFTIELPGEASSKEQA